MDINSSILVAYIMTLPFVGTNSFQDIVQKFDLTFAKDAAYDILKSENIIGGDLFLLYLLK